VTATSAISLADVDLTDQDAFQRAVPYDWFRLLRERAPVHWNPERSGRGFWSVTRYADVVAVSRDTATYSSERGASALEDLEPDALEARKSMIDMDPPGHTRLRRKVAPEFTRRGVSHYEQLVRETVTEVLDAALPKGEFDFVPDVATEVPIRVLCRILGVPERDERRLVELGDRMFGNTDPDIADVLLDSPASEQYRLVPFRSPAALEMHDYARWLARQHLADPGADLMSRLVRSDNSGPALVGKELDAMFLLLVVAGNETTRSALALGLQAFVENPEQWDAVRRGDARGLDSAVEEVLRFTTPLHHFRRTATRDTVLGGTSITEGDKVVVWFTSANRDEEVYADPDAFDVTRDPNPHVAFGRGGPHRCIGEHLARLEIRIVLEQLLARTERFEVVGSPRRVRSNFSNALTSLPVRVVGARSAGG